MMLTQDCELVSCTCELWLVTAGDREVGVVDTSDSCAAMQMDLNKGEKWEEIQEIEPRETQSLTTGEE